MDYDIQKDTREICERLSALKKLLIREDELKNQYRIPKSKKSSQKFTSFQDKNHKQSYNVAKSYHPEHNPKQNVIPSNNQTTKKKDNYPKKYIIGKQEHKKKPLKLLHTDKRNNKKPTQLNSNFPTKQDDLPKMSINNNFRKEHCSDRAPCREIDLHQIFKKRTDIGIQTTIGLLLDDSELGETMAFLYNGLPNAPFTVKLCFSLKQRYFRKWIAKCHQKAFEMQNPPHENSFNSKENNVHYPSDYRTSSDDVSQTQHNKELEHSSEIVFSTAEDPPVYHQNSEPTSDQSYNEVFSKKPEYPKGKVFLLNPPQNNYLKQTQEFNYQGVDDFNEPKQRKDIYSKVHNENKKESSDIEEVNEMNTSSLDDPHSFPLKKQSEMKYQKEKSNQQKFANTEEPKYYEEEDTSEAQFDFNETTNSSIKEVDTEEDKNEKDKYDDNIKEGVKEEEEIYLEEENDKKENYREKNSEEEFVMEEQLHLEEENDNEENYNAKNSEEEFIMEERDNDTEILAALDLNYSAPKPIIEHEISNDSSNLEEEDTQKDAIVIIGDEPSKESESIESISKTQPSDNQKVMTKDVEVSNGSIDNESINDELEESINDSAEIPNEQLRTHNENSKNISDNINDDFEEIKDMSNNQLSDTVQSKDNEFIDDFEDSEIKSNDLDNQHFSSDNKLNGVDGTDQVLPKDNYYSLISSKEKNFSEDNEIILSSENLDISDINKITTNPKDTQKDENDTIDFIASDLQTPPVSSENIESIDDIDITIDDEDQ